MLAGPMDYTPGGFNNVSWADFTPRQLNPMVPTTRSHQVALFVVLEAPFQMLCDYPGAYLEAPELPFLKAVPATWDETRVLAGRPGRFAVIARRQGATWYVGGITGFDAADVDLKLDFLAAGRYTAATYADAPGNPKATVRANRTVTRASTLKVSMAPTGGWAAMLTPAK
jgi:alpha-glucosidase